MKFYKDLSDMPSQVMRADREMVLNIYCKNKHYIAALKMTPFCVAAFQVKCKICGTIAGGSNIEMHLEGPMKRV